jgi:hypothetical protein
MKTFLITLTIILLASLTNSEAQNKSERENLKTITQLVGNYYSMVMVNAFGETLQEGQYYKEGNKFLEHGIWKLYDYNTQKLITKAKYNKGVQIWVETNIDGIITRVTQRDIELNNLKIRIAELEKQLANFDS